jgi:hypothetical protein
MREVPGAGGVAVIEFGLFDADGLPLAGASPTFAVYASAPGVSRTPPTIADLGAGRYGFTPATADVEAGTAYLIGAGHGATPRFLSGGLGAMVAFGLYDSHGAPWAGAAPTIAHYRDDDGTDREKPAVLDFGSGLYGFRPTDADRRAETRYVVQAPAGAAPASYTGTVPVLSKLTTTPAIEHDLTILDRGATWAVDFPPLAEALAEDALVALHIRESYHPVGRIFARPRLTLDETRQVITASLTGEETGKIPAGSWFYDVKATDAEKTARLYFGRVEVRPDVTR